MVKKKDDVKVEVCNDGPCHSGMCHSHYSAHTCGNAAGFIYGLGFLGSAIYFIGHATGFWNGVLGFLKAIVWPVFLVHGLLKFIGA